MSSATRPSKEEKKKTEKEYAFYRDKPSVVYIDFHDSKLR